jgi:hypothetical protein
MHSRRRGSVRIHYDPRGEQTALRRAPNIEAAEAFDAAVRELREEF